MTERISNICRLEYAPVSAINTFIEASEGHLLIDASWTEIPIIPGATLSVRKSHTKAGRLYESSFSAMLRSKLDLHQIVIIRITLDKDETQYIIGDPDLPVRLDETVSIRQKPISFSHQSWHFPWIFAGEPEEVESEPDPEPDPEPEPDPVPVTINWELSEWESEPDFIDANVRIYANEVLKLEQFGNGTGTVNVFQGDTIRIQYSYLDIAEGSPESPFLQLLIDSVLIDSQPVSIPGTGTFNHSFEIDSNKEILVRAVDLG
ncbi:hypothetical protein [Algoriphagus marincola]|uniref:hypothetical protein n=1 Tax=Algoriphagus marincola TaxID=264027 RepID=UPI00042367A7|nr:hypothetical protein [Algoriphagus marincola]